jgi:hypothetical protein
MLKSCACHLFERNFKRRHALAAVAGIHLGSSVSYHNDGDEMQHGTDEHCDPALATGNGKTVVERTRNGFSADRADGEDR